MKRLSLVSKKTWIKLSKIINSLEKLVRAKRKDDQTTPVEKDDFFQMKPIDLSLLVTTKSIPNADDDVETADSPEKYSPVEIKAITQQTKEKEPIEEEYVYDYEDFKREYDERMGKYTTVSLLLNNTDEEHSEKSPEETIKNLLDFKNCTETSKKYGIKAVDCLIYNYEHEPPKIKKSVQKVWLIIKVWFLIYVCLAIPCWCQKGWCCCCFRCKFCFPNKRILLAKQYYAVNPPGTLAKEVKKKEKTQEFITYEPTEFEEDAFERFESEIRNI
ncbi:uncharacterized protein LOC143210658 isoform X1 [Lasioglossum baleicum]|uniref:uncharacterized protein LOC143210658 isoform X1 n=1 Tax=Lasioglossum baleicum TaxID=434251 RepID=UPI003FCEC7EB